MNETTLATVTEIGKPVNANAAEPMTEAKYKKALKRLARLEKQNVFLIDELVKSRQCLMQMKMEREIILDRVADSLVIEDYDFEASEDEDLSDVSEDESSAADLNTPARKRELIDALVDGAEGDESFGRVLSELSGYQPAIGAEPRKKTISLNLNTASSMAGNASSSSKKRSRPVTSGSRFNRLSPFTQAMRTGIISDDENGGINPSALVGAPEYATDSEDLELEGELAQLKKVRRLSNSGGHAPSINSLLNTPVKEESAVLKVIQVPFDAEGRAILPLSLNMITVQSLGEVVFDRPAYHNKRYILPVGFTTKRSYFSVTAPESSCYYLSTILDNGPAPLYQVTPEGHPEMAFQSASTTGAWAAVAKAAASIRGKDTAPSVSGPDYFGLANPTVSMLIERLPNAEKCESYMQKKYEVSNLVGGKNVKIATSNITNAVHVDIDTESSQPKGHEEASTDIQMMGTRNISRMLRRASRATFVNYRVTYSTSRTVCLDELLRHPILERASADPDTLQDLDAFPVPILPHQLSDSLRREFGRPVTTRTDWSFSPTTLEEVRGDYWRAARLIHETLAVWRNRPGNPIEPESSATANCQRPSRGIETPSAYSDSVLAWIQAECTKMFAELQSGCSLRYESPEHLLPENVQLTPEQAKFVQPALVAVGKAKELHPAIKKEIIGHICSVITTSLKK